METPPTDSTTGYRSIPLQYIKPSPYQARRDFNPEAMRELAESMRHEGLIEPIIVRPVEGGYELISGERRVRAARALNWEMIDAKVVHTISEAEAVAKGLIENIQRENLNPIEEAEGFFALNKLDKKYWTQQKIAEVSGKSQTYVSQSINLFKLPKEIMENIRALIFSRSHGVELARLPTPELQLQVARQIKGKMTWQETRQLVDSLLKRKPGANPANLAAKTDAHPVDPLAGTWPDLLSKPDVKISGTWKASYGPAASESGQTKPVGWNFFITVTPGQNPKPELARWFRAMANALDLPAAEKIKPVIPVKAQPAILEKPQAPVTLVPLPPAPEKIPLPVAKKTQPPVIEKQQSPVKNSPLIETPKIIGTLNDKRVRLPADAQEQTELEMLAAKGPGAMYAWIWGADSFISKKTRNSSWADLGFEDATMACRLIVDSLRATHTAAKN